MCDRTHPSVKLIKGEREIEGEMVRERERGGGVEVLTERFGQMDGQTGRALSALSDLTRRDRRMEGQDGRGK